MKVIIAIVGTLSAYNYNMLVDTVEKFDIDDDIKIGKVSYFDEKKLIHVKSKEAYEHIMSCFNVTDKSYLEYYERNVSIVNIEDFDIMVIIRANYYCELTKGERIIDNLIQLSMDKDAELLFVNESAYTCPEKYKNYDMMIFDTLDGMLGVLRELLYLSNPKVKSKLKEHPTNSNTNEQINFLMHIMEIYKEGREVIDNDTGNKYIVDTFPYYESNEIFVKLKKDQVFSLPELIPLNIFVGKSTHVDNWRFTLIKKYSDIERRNSFKEGDIVQYFFRDYLDLDYEGLRYLYEIRHIGVKDSKGVPNIILKKLENDEIISLTFDEFYREVDKETYPNCGFRYEYSKFEK